MVITFISDMLFLALIFVVLGEPYTEVYGVKKVGHTPGPKILGVYGCKCFRNVARYVLHSKIALR
jgi:hypothetical protein